MSSPGKPGTTSSRQPASKTAKSSGTTSNAANEGRPYVYTSIKKLIESVGVEEYEPQVVDMIIDFIYSYTTDVLRDAQAFGDGAGQAQGKVNLADVELAIHSRADMSFAQSPNLEALFAISERVNSKQLPEVIGAPGLPLPPINALLAPNAQFRCDTDDPATIAGSSISADPVVPTPSGIPIPSAPPQMPFNVPTVPSVVPGACEEPISSAGVAAAVEADGIAVSVPEAENEPLIHEDVDMSDEVPFIPPP